MLETKRMIMCQCGEFHEVGLICPKSGKTAKMIVPPQRDGGPNVEMIINPDMPRQSFFQTDKGIMIKDG